MVVRKKMFRDCSRFRTIGLFVNCSAVLVKTVFKSSFCFSYVLFVAAVAMYHVNNVFRVAVYMMSDMSRFAGRMKCVTGTSVRYVVACQTCVGLGSLALTNKLLRLLVRRKATRGVALKTLAHRGDEDRMLKCL